MAIGLWGSAFSQPPPAPLSHQVPEVEAARNSCRETSRTGRTRRSLRPPRCPFRSHRNYHLQVSLSPTCGHLGTRPSSHRAGPSERPGLSTAVPDQDLARPHHPCAAPEGPVSSAASQYRSFPAEFAKATGAGCLPPWNQMAMHVRPSLDHERCPPASATYLNGPLKASSDGCRLMLAARPLPLQWMWPPSSCQQHLLPDSSSRCPSLNGRRSQI